MIKTIALDQDGYFLLQNGVRLTDAKVGKEMLKGLRIDNYGVIHMDFQNETYVVEAFDKPYVARQVHVQDNTLQVQMPYHLQLPVDLSSLCLDEWDRFHGLTKSGVPFVLSRPAQAELLNLADEFSDDSLTLLGHTIHTEPYYIVDNNVEDVQFWSERYQEDPSPGWNLEAPHPELKSVLSQIKINKMRVLVPGCGYGHDAALLSEAGHVVTAVDMSPEAIAGAKKRYGHLKNLEFIEQDIFQLDETHHRAYDMIFEHTCYCAVHPNLRNELFKTYRRYLDETGHLLAVFFVIPKRKGPYFGSSEWELQNQLEKNFNFLYWTRLKHSPDWRQGAELLIYAQIKAPS